MMTDLEMMKSLMSRGIKTTFVEDVATFRMVRTDMNEEFPPFTTVQVNGIFPRLTITKLWGTMIILFDKDGYIVEMNAT